MISDFYLYIYKNVLSFRKYLNLAQFWHQIVVHLYLPDDYLIPVFMIYTEVHNQD